MGKMSLEQKIEFIQSSDNKSLNSHLGIQLTDIALEKLSATMPVDERTRQPFGILHGGASVVLSECLASIGAWLHVNETRYEAVGIEINANHLRSVRDGVVIGIATPTHIGGKIHVWDIQIRNPKGEIICVSRCTIAIIPRR